MHQEVVVTEELVPGKGGLEEDDTHPHQGGDGPAGVWNLF